MKRITVDIFGEEDGYLKDMLEISSDDLCITYADFNGGAGLQCNFDGNKKEFDAIEEKCYQINNLARELNKIYK